MLSLRKILNIPDNLRRAAPYFHDLLLRLFQKQGASKAQAKLYIQDLLNIAKVYPLTESSLPFEAETNAAILTYLQQVGLIPSSRTIE